MATSLLNAGKFTVTFGDDDILTTLTASGGVVHNWLQEIQGIHGRRLSHLVVGLDVEWRPSFVRGVPPGRIALLQICVGRCCLVFQILRADYVPQSLANFLDDERFTFVGVGIDDDVAKLSNEYGLGVRNTADLRYLAAETLGKPALRGEGLKGVVAEVMGVQMNKPRRVQVGAWDSPRLSSEQLHYASIDAFVSFEVGRRLYDGDY